ncbi:MAG: acetyl-CoA synthase subunit gamma, partial [Coriobacteriia bacterium]|nr:acetyl-CoA synthase subunit gamma [Coriobacteriia bacterium]
MAATSLSFKDTLRGWKVRWGIGRMDYKIESGLYAVGKPDTSSPVLVSANYKLTFDALRKNLGGLDCWLLILDTKGINVWCAAGKG